jgi:hypothetical protein
MKRIIISAIFTFLMPFLTGERLSAQISFNEILSLEHSSYTDVQSELLKSFEIVDDIKSYTYTPIIKCKPHELFDDSCAWKCSMPDYLKSQKFSFPVSTVIFNDSLIKNYKLEQISESSFAENYNDQTKAATTFIRLSENLYSDNGNCHNTMETLRRVYKIELQFADEKDWLKFKQEVIASTTFLRTYKYAEDSPIEMIYGIKRNLTENGYQTGISISLYKSASIPVWHAHISFLAFL